MSQGQMATADALAQRLLDLVQHQPDTGFAVEGHFVMGAMASYRGDFLAARAQLEHSCRLADSVPSSAPLLHGGMVSEVPLRTWLARVLWALGYADQAQQRSQEAVALAQQMQHTPSLAYAEAECRPPLPLPPGRRGDAGTRRGVDGARQRARLWGAPGAGAHAARVGTGHAGRRGRRPGAAPSGVGASQDVGPEILRPHWLAALAEAYGRAGQPQAGLQVLAEAVTLMATTEMRWWEAEVSRLQGELLLHLPSPDVPQAEAAFLRALDVARRQQAKALELRAALSLRRLWQQQGQREAARDLLAPLYAWFTEGFDTPDLQEAKTLLAAIEPAGK